MNRAKNLKEIRKKGKKRRNKEDKNKDRIMKEMSYKQKG